MEFFKLLIVVSCSVFITALLPNKQVKGHSVGSSAEAAGAKIEKR